MKNLILICFLCFASVGFANNPSDNLINALICVESNGNDYALGDNGNAIGCLQIWECVIDDVNRIYKTHYTHKDAYNRTKSIAICKAYLRHYAPANASDEVFARIWNGGPKGHKKQSTLKYWNKVKKALKKVVDKK